MLTSPGLDGHKNATARDMRAARMGEVDTYFEKWRLYLCFCTHPTETFTNKMNFQHFQALSKSRYSSEHYRKSEKLTRKFSRQIK